MSLPWYVTGAARPDYAKYKGWEKDTARTQKAVQKARNSQLPASTWTPPSTTAAAPSALRPEWAPAPTWPTQERVAAQPAPQSTRPGILESVWNSVVDFGGEPGKSDDLSRARDAQAQRDLLQQRSEDFYAQRRREVAHGPFGLTFDPNSTTPLSIQPGVNLAGRDVQADRANAATAARLTAAADAYEKQQAREDKAEQRAARRSNRDRKENVVVLTQDEWNAMTPAQQNAVRFNSDLYAAVERDKANQDQYDPTAQERQAYDAILNDVFGTTQSDNPYGITYAPETVGVLKNLDLIPAQDLGTLDDFLKMDVAITAKQVQQIERALQPEGPEHLVGRAELTPAEQRLERAQALTRAQGQITSRLEGELERGRRVLAGMSEDQARVEAAKLGAVLDESESLVGQLDQQQALDVDYVVRFMAEDRHDVQEGLRGFSAMVEERGYDENTQQKMYQAIIESVQNAATDGPWQGLAEDVPLRTPQQVADALGIPLQKVG